jgi:hypothetical protein
MQKEVENLENCARIGLKDVLYLTDFSSSSEAALPVARGIVSAVQWADRVCSR